MRSTCIISIMDSQSSESRELNPQPSVSNQASIAGSVAPTNPQVPQAQAIAGQKETTNMVTPSSPFPGISTASVSPIPQNLSSVTANTSQTPMPSLADDTDLIEKEWVNKAKQIVEHNREDPYEQSKALTIFKADYMKKRYNRTIKPSE
jgi:hypothetical protein